MGKITITPTTTVLKLKEEFKNEFGGTLRVYNGRSEAKDDETLVSLGAKTGSIEFRASRTVGSFCKEVQNELNLKVKVATIDNWVMVLDGITLATVKDIPKQCTKAQMEELIGYKRKIESTNSLSNPCFEGWEKSVELAKKTKSVSIPLHKYGDGYAIEEDIKEMANDYIFFLTDNKGNFKGFLYNGWDNIQEFMDGNPEYSSIYYYSNGDYQISESTNAIYQSDEEWPTVDRTMDEAIVETVNMETEYYYPNIDFNLIYNGDVIYENNLAS